MRRNALSLIAPCALRLGKVNRDMNPQIQHRLDQLLLEQGEYNPPESLPV